jgi:hypothetical protein
MLGEEINFLTDAVRAKLYTSSYTLDRLTHDYEDDLGANEVANGDGYTTNGELLTTKTVVTTSANSWADTWAATTAVEADYVVRPTTGNGFLYRCVTAGTTSGTEPATWPTVIGEDVADGGTVVWECVARAIVVIDCDPIAWADATFTARYLVVIDVQPGTTATNPLIGVVDFGTDETGQGGAFTVTPDAQGLLHFFVA